MGLLSKLKDQYILKCSDCGKAIKPGEFMCVMGKSPAKSWDGQTEQIINRLVKDTEGKIYCASCFNHHFKQV